MYDGTFATITDVVSRPCSPTPCTSSTGFGPPQATVSTGVTTPNADSIQADLFAIRGSFSWSGSPTPPTLGAGVGVLDNALIYTPSIEGSITSLDVSLEQDDDREHRLYPARVLLEQDGKYYQYVSASQPITAGHYVNYNSTGLTSSSFTQICMVSCGTGGFTSAVAGGTGPDFSASGDAIVFGVLYTSNFAAGNISAFYDNYHVVIDTPDVAATPLPAALPLFASGLGAMGFIGWRRKRKATAA